MDAMEAGVRILIAGAIVWRYLFVLSTFTVADNAAQLSAD